MPGHAIVKRLEEKRREILRLVAPHRHATATSHSTHGRHASRRGGGGGDSDSHRNPYRLWKRVRDLRLGSRSQQVYLLENPRNRKERVVLKRYDASDRHHRGRYDKELKVLKRLRGCPHAPQLLHSDDDTCALWMTYCGRVAPMNPRTKAAVEAILKELADKWGVHRVSNGGAVNRLDAASIFPKNITQIDGHTKLIDYGSPSWRLTPI